MGRQKSRWVDKLELAWTPDKPLIDKPFSQQEKRLEPSREPALAGPARPRTRAASTSGTAPPWGPNRSRAPLFLVLRLIIGLVQGLVLAGLIYTRAHNLWPHAAFADSLIMATALAPPLLIQGLVQIPLRPLLIWTLCASLCLGGLGAYHHWRIVGAVAGHSGLWFAGMAAVLLFIGQSLLLSETRSAPGPLRYPIVFEFSWALAIQIFLSGLFALFAEFWFGAAADWANAQWSIASLGWFEVPVATLSLALAVHFTGPGRMRMPVRGLSCLFAACLPLLIGLVISATLLWGLAHWQPPFLLSVSLGLLLILSINASYRGGLDWRPQWRRWLEFAAAFLLLPPAGMAGLSLQARIAGLGFTAPRLVAVALVMLLWAYGVTYIAAALISLGGGRWMHRLEGANVLMAFVTMSLIAALVSPLADPVRLAVASQAWRLSHNETVPARFDYEYLRRSGLRFGHRLLMKLASDRDKSTARPASRMLRAKPNS